MFLFHTIPFYESSKLICVIDIEVNSIILFISTDFGTSFPVETQRKIFVVEVLYQITI
jgi:hypothetical protein